MATLKKPIEDRIIIEFDASGRVINQIPTEIDRHWERLTHNAAIIHAPDMPQQPVQEGKVHELYVKDIRAAIFQLEWREVK